MGPAPGAAGTAASLPPQGIFISRIAEGGAAHRAGTLQVGDRVLSVSRARAPRRLPRRPPAPDGTAAPSQINGVDMAEARHDHAVSLLTAAAPTIALLLEREAGGSLPPSPPPLSPLPPPAAPTPGATANATGAGPLRLAPSLLAAALEGPYPVEVRTPAPPSPHPNHRALGSCSVLSPGPLPLPSLPQPHPDPWCPASAALTGWPRPSRLGVPRRSACRGRGARWGSAWWGAPTTPATRSAPRSPASSSPR